jgi:hypothetical protein
MKMGNTHSLWRYDLALKALPLSADARRSRHSLYEAATRDDRRRRGQEHDAGLPEDPTKPYVMWPGTPYEHLMLPVK